MRFPALMMLFAICSYADTITMTHTGLGSGSIGTTTFTDAAFTITDIGDTGNRQSFTGGFFIDDTSASINIAGLGTFNFTTGTRTFVNNGSEEVGFSRATTTGFDLFDGPANGAFAAWDMLSSIGPISGTALLQQWTGASFPDVDTNGGVLVFDTMTSDTTFTATVNNAVPEPSSTVPLAIGCLGIVAVARRRWTRGQRLRDTA